MDDDDKSAIAGCRKREVRTVSQFVDTVTELRCLAREDISILFRGEKSVDFDPQPKIDRPEFADRRDELELLEAFARGSGRCFDSGSDRCLELMALAAHHGVPTRLLDWSLSPLVAAYFATEPDKAHADSAAAVWILAGATVLPAYAQPRKWGALRRLDGLFAFQPPAVSPRVLAQRSMFTIHAPPSLPGATWIAKHGPSVIVIPASVRGAFHEELAYLGLTPSSLFPGLDGLGTDLARFAATRSPDAKFDVLRRRAKIIKEQAGRTDDGVASQPPT